MASFRDVRECDAAECEVVVSALAPKEKPVTGGAGTAESNAKAAPATSPAPKLPKEKAAWWTLSMVRRMWHRS